MIGDNSSSIARRQIQGQSYQSSHPFHCRLIRRIRVRTFQRKAGQGRRILIPLLGQHREIAEEALLHNQGFIRQSLRRNSLRLCKRRMSKSKNDEGLHPNAGHEMSMQSTTLRRQVTTPPKKRLRELARNTLARFSPEEYRQRTTLLVHNLSQYIKRHFPDSQRIATYSALPHEADLSLLHGLLPEKQLLYPLVLNRLEIAFHLVTDPTTLRKGAYDVLEPSPLVHPPVAANDLDLILVPGLAFDLKGNRLGHGAGYYDRFLTQIPMTPTIGVTFGSQLLPEVPTEPHDRPMAFLSSDRGVIAV